MTNVASVMSEQSIHVTRLDLLVHDLRTPISCISGAAQMALLSAHSGARVEDYLKQILSAVNSLNAMTGELLREEAIASSTAVWRELKDLKFFVQEATEVFPSEVGDLKKFLTGMKDTLSRFLELFPKLSENQSH